VNKFVWILLEDVGELKIRQSVKRPLTGLRAAPFYGCYLQRPSEALGFDEQPSRAKSLETVMTMIGTEVVDFPGKTRCCGFPLLTINEPNSLQMVAHHTSDAKAHGADVMVTPCPLCHLNLDGLQSKAARRNNQAIDLPILHLPQLLGLAMGMEPKALGLNRNLVSTGAVLEKLTVA